MLKLFFNIWSLIKNYFMAILVFDYSYKERMTFYGVAALVFGCVAFTISLFHPIHMIVHFAVGGAYIISFGIPLVLICELRVRFIKKYFQRNTDFYVIEAWIVSFFIFLTGYYILGTLQVIVGWMDMEMFSYYYDPEKQLQPYSIDFFVKMLAPWIIDTLIPIHVLLKRRKITAESDWTEAETVNEVTFSSGTLYISIDPRQITHISIEEHYASIYVKINGTLEEKQIKLSLANIMKKLPDNMFVRTHRSYAVNLMYVAELYKNSNGYYISVKNSDQKLPISRRNISTVRNKMNEFQNQHNNEV